MYSNLLQIIKFIFLDLADYEGRNENICESKNTGNGTQSEVIFLFRYYIICIVVPF